MVEVMQVKKYHDEVASKKFDTALNSWFNNGAGAGMPLSTMFFFRKTDRQGFETTYRKNGYIAFGKNKAVFGKNKTEAIKKFRR